MFRQTDKKIPQYNALHWKFSTVFLPRRLCSSTHLGFSDYFPLSEIEKTTADIPWVKIFRQVQEFSI
jgi:hypothetical protein